MPYSTGTGVGEGAGVILIMAPGGVIGLSLLNWTDAAQISFYNAQVVKFKLTNFLYRNYVRDQKGQNLVYNVWSHTKFLPKD